MDTVQDKLDLLQFVYRSGRGVDVAIGMLFNMEAKSLVRLPFIDFPSALNCIQSHILADRLKSIHNIDAGLICWSMNFSTMRSQWVRVHGVLLDVLFFSSPLFYLSSKQMNAKAVTRDATLLNSQLILLLCPSPAVTSLNMVL